MIITQSKQICVNAIGEFRHKEKIQYSKEKIGYLPGKNHDQVLPGKNSVLREKFCRRRRSCLLRSRQGGSGPVGAGQGVGGPGECGPSEGGSWRAG